MAKLNILYDIVSRYKYLVVGVFGVLFVGFLDSNSMYRMWELIYEENELRNEIARFERKYENDRKQLRDLQRDPKNITRIARERYFMKANDEDIFVLSTDKKTEEDLLE